MSNPDFSALLGDDMGLDDDLDEDTEVEAAEPSYGAFELAAEEFMDPDAPVEERIQSLRAAIKACVAEGE